VTPGAEWVVAGEGVATRKWDGTCCLIRGGVLFKRYEVKPGGKPPANFEPANEPDEATGKQQGWVPVGNGPEDQYHREALAYARLSGPDQPYYGIRFDLAVDMRLAIPKEGTYELCGPKVQGNPDNLAHHQFIRHGVHSRRDSPRDFDGLREYLRTANIEGIVWHHPDGRLVKIKAKDFGLKRIEPRSSPVAPTTD
jgi:hypothetical protein